MTGWHREWPYQEWGWSAAHTLAAVSTCVVILLFLVLVTGALSGAPSGQTERRIKALEAEVARLKRARP